MATRRGNIFLIRDEKGQYRLDHVLVQDAMAWETQGAITDRTQEHLGVGDEGIIIFRKLLHEQIDKVRKGGEPLGVIRDPQMNRIIEFDVINERIAVYGMSAEGRVSGLTLSLECVEIATVIPSECERSKTDFSRSLP